MNSSICEEQPHAISKSKGLQGICLAKTRSGQSCKALKVRGRKRCRMHGGAIGSGAQRGNKNAYKHGRYSKEQLAARHAMQLALKSIIKLEKIDLRKMDKRSINEFIARYLRYNRTIDTLMPYFKRGKISPLQISRLIAKARKNHNICSDYELLKYIFKKKRLL